MLYPSIQPFDSGWLDAGQGHRIYWEQCGRRDGLPVLFLHGGPGGGCSDRSRRLFDPQQYRMVLFDQRGCGRSTPHASIESNDCGHLLQDMELLRQHLQIEQWVLCGGSWGCTLALAYTKAHRERVLALVLRSVFTGQANEVAWLFGPNGAAKMFPDEWHRFATALGDLPPDSLLPAYVETLAHGTVAQQQAAALAWCRWESSISSVYPQDPAEAQDAQQCLAMARISSHILATDLMLELTDRIWPVDYLSGLPGIIVQGRFDLVTPGENAWQLHKHWPGSELRWVHEAGHVSSDPPLLQAWMKALEDMARRCR